jgi:hypothetical protein
MPIMQEAVPKEDWERMEKGLPPINRKPEPRPDPENPKVDDQISLKKIDFQRLISAKRENRRNKDKVLFIGFSVRMEIKEGAGVKSLGGWVPEAEWLEFLRINRGKINMEGLQI